MKYGPETCKYGTQSKLRGPGTETNEVRYTRGTQSNAPMKKTNPKQTLGRSQTMENWPKMMAQQA